MEGNNGEKVKDSDLLIFRHYQLLACAILQRYWKDKKREEEKLNKARIQMEKRIKEGRSKGLIRRWTPQSAEQSFRQMEQNFEDFCYWENTELYEFYWDIASYRPSKNEKSSNEIKGKKIC